ncbi:hypothetical protein [Peribacillus asahii]|uniref:hypothetical protein n=1 Tax=Peribacillus asahii TaxID=228899 RepID=UPI003815E425
MKLTKEVTYVFDFEGFTNKVDVFVDNVENRRYENSDPLSLGSEMNYQGTGNPYQEIQAELLSSTEVQDTPPWLLKQVRLFYRLPDVNAYAVGEYREEAGELEDEGTVMKSLSVRLIDKL